MKHDSLALSFALAGLLVILAKVTVDPERTAVGLGYYTSQQLAIMSR